MSGYKSSRSNGSRRLRECIVGRTISGVIARPGRAGEPPVVLMLRFEDGGVVDFVSPRSDRMLESALAAGTCESGVQLPLDGLFGLPSNDTNTQPLATGCA